MQGYDMVHMTPDPDLCVSCSSTCDVSLGLCGGGGISYTMLRLTLNTNSSEQTEQLHGLNNCFLSIKVYSKYGSTLFLSLFISLWSACLLPDQKCNYTRFVQFSSLIYCNTSNYTLNSEITLMYIFISSSQCSWLNNHSFFDHIEEKRFITTFSGVPQRRMGFLLSQAFTIVTPRLLIRDAVVVVHQLLCVQGHHSRLSDPHI